MAKKVNLQRSRGLVFQGALTEKIDSQVLEANIRINYVKNIYV